MKRIETNKQCIYTYLDKMGVKYTVDKNPSPERVLEIKAKIERNKSRGL